MNMKYVECKNPSCERTFHTNNSKIMYCCRPCSENHEKKSVYPHADVCDREELHYKDLRDERKINLLALEEIKCVRSFMNEFYRPFDETFKYEFLELGKKYEGLSTDCDIYYSCRLYDDRYISFSDGSYRCRHVFKYIFCDEEDGKENDKFDIGREYQQYLNGINPKKKKFVLRFYGDEEPIYFEDDCFFFSAVYFKYREFPGRDEYVLESFAQNKHKLITVDFDWIEIHTSDPNKVERLFIDLREKYSARQMKKLDIRVMVDLPERIRNMIDDLVVPKKNIMIRAFNGIKELTKGAEQCEIS